MSRDWQATFESWGAPPSTTEEEERDRTEAEIRKALEPLASTRQFRVYPKGSYRRGTNVRRGSDIDMAVELRGTPNEQSFRVKKAFEAESLTDADLGLIDISTPGELLDMANFKRDVYNALVEAYGTRAVKWDDKCLKVREAATTLPADVVPCRYYKRFDSRAVESEGVEIKPDDGSSIINWPTQDDENGVTKNKNTNLRFQARSSRTEVTRK
jgi:predicted nucleotidyltransferase